MAEQKEKRLLMVRQTGLAGAQNAVSLCNAISRSGYRVSLLVLNGERERCGLDEAVDVIGSTGARITRLQAARDLYCHLGRNAYEIVYVVDSWTIPVFWLATMGRMRVKGSKVVYHTFDWLEPGEVSRLHIHFEKLLSGKADLVVNADRSRARMQRTMYGLKDTPLWLQNALSVKKPIPPVSDDAAEKMLGRPRRDGERIIIYPALVAGKGAQDRQVFELVQAMSLLPASFTAVLFALEGDEYSRCCALAEERGITSRVRFLKPVPFEDLLGYVRNSDFGVIFYSDDKSSGYFMCNADKLSLYAACGVPYVASDFPNLEAITYKHGLGVCCDSSDPTGIAAAVRLLDAKFPDHGGERQRIRKVFEDELCLERHIGALQQALGRL